MKFFSGFKSKISSFLSETKGAKKYLFIIFSSFLCLVITVVIVIGLFFLIRLPFSAIEKKQQQTIAEYQSQINALQLEIASIQNKLDNESEDDILEEAARQQGYSKPEEKHYYDVTPGN